MFFPQIRSLLAPVETAAGVLKLKVRLCRMLNADPGRKQTLALAAKRRAKNKPRCPRTWKEEGGAIKPEELQNCFITFFLFLSFAKETLIGRCW